MDSVRFSKDSIRFKKEASRCQTAVKVASFLESHIPTYCYDEACPDLRQNPIWQGLEVEFMATGGLISEDWEDEESEIEDSKPVKVLRPGSNKNRDAIGLVLVIIVSGIVGGTLGWFFPYQSLPQPSCKFVIK